MFNFHKNHRNLVIVSLGVYVFLSIIIAIIPAYKLQAVQPLPNQNPLSAKEQSGLKVYVAENCAACHTQQVRNIDMDKMWGDRPSMPSDYFYSKKRLDVWRQSPSLLGSERTGPDLTNVGKRQSGAEWHLLHLYNPRIVVKESIMPGYPWLFTEKDSAQILANDVVVPVPKKYLSNPNKKVVAGKKALELVAYLLTLKQTELPEAATPSFIASSKEKLVKAAGGKSGLPDGTALYAQHCAACHQPDGTGLVGAFPPLVGSPIVNDTDIDLYVKIILQGYDARSEFGIMPGFAEQLTDEEITAIINHERSSWGNKAEPIEVEKVKSIREFVMKLNQ